MTAKSPINDVSDTAFMVAAYRAKESERNDALFKDPFAARLAGEKGKHIIANLPKSAFLGGWTVIIRTRIIDEFILDAITNGVDTVINIGAGLDARPYRMNLPGELQWFEVDYPHVIDLKSEILIGETAHCQLKRVGLDLGDDLKRREFLREVTSKGKKVLILTEGVIPYLSNEAVHALASDLIECPSVQYFIADYFSEASYRYRKKSGMSKTMERAPFIFEPENYFDFFQNAGWVPKETRYFAEVAKILKRPAPFPLRIRLITKLLSSFAPPEKRKEMGRFAGFVLFERSSSVSVSKT